MQTSPLFIGTAALFCSGQTVHLFLRAVNLCCLRRHKTQLERNPETRNTYSYQQQHLRLDLLYRAVFFSAVLIFLFQSPWIYQTLGSRLSSLSIPRDGLVHTILYVLILRGVLFCLKLPFRLYRIFGIEERFGFNRMSFGLFLKDLARSSLISFPIQLALLTGFYLAVSRLAFWWWWSFLCALGFLVLSFWTYPILIAPLFNRFEPLPEGPLRTRLQELLQKTGFRSQNLFVIDNRKRSTHSNAYFTGIGSSCRIVLYEELIERFSPPQIAAILAHEIGHYRRKHILQNLSRSAAGLLAGFFLLGILHGWEPLFQAFGFLSPNPAALIAISFVLLNSIDLCLAWHANRISRKFEFEADQYSAKMTDPELTAAALQKIYTQNLGNPFPHPAYVSVFYSHPPLADRISRLKAETASQ